MKISMCRATLKSFYDFSLGQLDQRDAMLLKETGASFSTISLSLSSKLFFQSNIFFSMAKDLQPIAL